MDTSNMKPREVEAYLRQQVLRIWDDKVENGAVITSSHGYYSVEIQNGQQLIKLSGFRKQDASKIVKSLRALRDK